MSPISPPTPGLDVRQLRDYVVRPVLAYLSLPGDVPNSVSERLILGTAAHESHGFDYLRQLGSGPARGLWQMEPFTFNDLWARFPETGPIGRKLRTMTGAFPIPLSDQLMGNLYLACAMCRVHYYARPFRMPVMFSLAEIAGIWKKHYNTYLGAGRVEEFIDHYQKWVSPLYLID